MVIEIAFCLSFQLFLECANTLKLDEKRLLLLKTQRIERCQIFMLLNLISFSNVIICAIQSYQR